MERKKNESSVRRKKWKSRCKRTARFDCPSYKNPIERMLFSVCTILLLQFYLTSHLLNYIIVIVVVMTNVRVAHTAEKKEKKCERRKKIHSKAIKCRNKIAKDRKRNKMKWNLNKMKKIKRERESNWTREEKERKKKKWWRKICIQSRI